MESPASSPNIAHGIPFSKLVFQDALTFLTLFLLGGALLIQAIAIGGAFWSRARFGSHFDPDVYSAYATEKSSASVVQTFGLEDALKARLEAERTTPNEGTEVMSRAGQEHEQVRTREKDAVLTRKELERQADHWIQQADASIQKQAPDAACEYLRKALAIAPDYMPAITKLAQLNELEHDYTQACFQWERAASIAPPQSPQMKEIQRHLDRINRLRNESRKTQGPPLVSTTALRAAPPRVATVSPPVVPAGIRLSLAQITRRDLPPDELYDLHFNLRIAIGSTGPESLINPDQTQVEIHFYDCSTSAAGTLIPIKIKSTLLQPKQGWTAGGEQILTLKYSLPRGYLRSKGQLFGNSYAFCGYIVRVSYQGKLQDTYAEPANILGKYARPPSASDKKA